MCLDIKKNTKIQIVTRDIVCYKILSIGLISPYFGYYYRFNERTEHIDLEIEFGSVVEKGYHSFMEITDAINHIGRKDSLMIYRAIIPRGAQYIEGTWSGMRYPSYASSEIIITKAVIERKPIKELLPKLKLELKLIFKNIFK